MDWFGDVFFIISTHAPLAGRDVELLPLTTSKEEFQPTRPLRGATRRRRDGFGRGTISTHAPLAGRDRLDDRGGLSDAISTHAPLAGRDRRATTTRCRTRDFNPRAPCGARRQRGHHVAVVLGHFNPRAPCGARQ